MAEFKARKALVLSGGGGRGAYQAGVLRYLQERNWIPDLVTGTSVGSLNAAMIGMGWDAEQLGDFWRRVERKQVYTSPLKRWLSARLRRRRAVKGPGGLLDPAPLRRLLESVVHLDDLRASQIEVIITAVHVATARLCYFGSSEISVDHLMASCSLPVIFPWQLIENEPYWDGGLMANTPIAPALRSGASEIVVILLAPLSGAPSPLPRTRSQALEWAIEISTLGSAVTALESFFGPLEVSAQGPDFASEKAPDHSSGQRLAVVAPRQLLGVHSILKFDPSSTNELMEMGYRDARAQLAESLFPTLRSSE